MDHLSQMAMEARKAGMSYGKYVAQQNEKKIGERFPLPPPPPEPEPEALTEGISCGWCGTHFLPAHYNAKYCCKKCATRAHNYRNQTRKRQLEIDSDDAYEASRDWRLFDSEVLRGDAT